MSRYLLTLFVGSLLMVGCGDTHSPSSDQVAPPLVSETVQATSAANDTDANPSSDTRSSPENDVTVLAWEDLMPEGEDERLEQLYAEFYKEFEARLMNQQSSLSSTLSADDEMNLSLIAEGSDMDTMEQIGTFNVVEDLDGEKVRLPGYIVPLDFDANAEHKEFLLVPYFGACLHSPPPPPNQIIFVRANPPAKIPDIYDPVWLEGTMTTGRFDSELGNSAYELSLSHLEAYEY